MNGGWRVWIDDRWLVGSHTVGAVAFQLTAIWLDRAWEEEREGCGHRVHYANQSTDYLLQDVCC